MSSKIERATALSKGFLEVANKLIICETQKIKNFNKECDKNNSKAQAEKPLFFVKLFQWICHY